MTRAVFSSIKGELLLLQAADGAAGAADDQFRQAVDLARRRGALSWELRAATSLAPPSEQSESSRRCHRLPPADFIERIGMRVGHDLQREEISPSEVFFCFGGSGSGHGFANLVKAPVSWPENWSPA
jgi:hypothetical protein